MDRRSRSTRTTAIDVDPEREWIHDRRRHADQRPGQRRGMTRPSTARRRRDRRREAATASRNGPRGRGTSWLTMTVARYERFARATRIDHNPDRDDRDRARDLQEGGQAGRRPELVGDGAGGEVVWRVTIGSLSVRTKVRKSVHEETPAKRDRRDARARAGSRRPTSTACEPSGQQGPHEDDAGLGSDRRAERATDAEGDR